MAGFSLTELFIILIFIFPLPPVITGLIARRKGRSFWAWLGYGFLICTAANICTGMLKNLIVLPLFLLDLHLYVGGLSGPIIALFLKRREGKIVMKQTEAKRLIKRGIELFKNDQIEAALQVFEEGLEGGVKGKDSGLILYNIATCQVRIGQQEASIATLDKAISILPSIGPKVRRDKDFSELRRFESFQRLQRKYRGRFVRTGRWYLVWFLLAAVLGYLSSANTGQAPAREIGKFIGVSLVLAWIVGKLVEGVFAFIGGLRRQN